MTSNENEIINRYNNNMRMLCKIMKSKLSTDKNVENIIIKLNTGIQFDPLVLIRESGPYFIKYKEQINNKDITFFLNKNEWDDDIKDNKTVIMDIINKIKSIWVVLNENEQSILFRIVESLLCDYCHYVILNK